MEIEASVSTPQQTSEDAYIFQSNIASIALFFKKITELIPSRTGGWYKVNVCQYPQNNYLTSNLLPMAENDQEHLDELSKAGMKGTPLYRVEFMHSAKYNTLSIVVVLTTEESFVCYCTGEVNPLQRIGLFFKKRRIDRIINQFNANPHKRSTTSISRGIGHTEQRCSQQEGIDFIMDCVPLVGISPIDLPKLELAYVLS